MTTPIKRNKNTRNAKRYAITVIDSAISPEIVFARDMTPPFNGSYVLNVTGNVILTKSLFSVTPSR